MYAPAASGRCTPALRQAADPGRVPRPLSGQPDAPSLVTTPQPARAIETATTTTLIALPCRMLIPPVRRRGRRGTSGDGADQASAGGIGGRRATVAPTGPASSPGSRPQWRGNRPAKPITRPPRPTSEPAFQCG